MSGATDVPGETVEPDATPENPAEIDAALVQALNKALAQTPLPERTITINNLRWDPDPRARFIGNGIRANGPPLYNGIRRMIEGKTSADMGDLVIEETDLTVSPSRYRIYYDE